MRAWLWTAAVGLSVAAGMATPGAMQDRAASGSGRFAGRWTADLRSGWKGGDGPRVQLSLRSADGDERFGFGVRLAELDGLPAAARDGAVSSVTFRLVREAGTFTLRGAFDDGRGAGDYAFEPEARYAAAMAALGYRDLPREGQMRLALLDVTTTFAREIRDAGQSAVPLDDLVRFRIHGVTGGNIRDLAALGYRQLDADTLVRLRIHGATPERIRGLHQAGLRGVLADDLVRLRIHGVTPSSSRD